jgi:hypothetical protein
MISADDELNNAASVVLDGADLVGTDRYLQMRAAVGVGVAMLGGTPTPGCSFLLAVA